MNTYVHLLQYIAEFFSELEMCQPKIVEEIKTRFMFINYFSENHTSHMIM